MRRLQTRPAKPAINREQGLKSGVFDICLPLKKVEVSDDGNTLSYYDQRGGTTKLTKAGTQTATTAKMDLLRNKKENSKEKPK